MNDNDVALQVKTALACGVKSFADLAPGESGFQVFDTSESDAGRQAQVETTAVIVGKTISSTEIVADAVSSWLHDHPDLFE